MNYIYQKVKVVRVIDGDTIRLDIDMGNRITWTSNFRLMGINTPEKGQEGFATATEALKILVAGGLSRVETFKPDKWGRWLCALYIPANGGDLLVNQVMVTDGHAVSYMI